MGEQYVYVVYGIHKNEEGKDEVIILGVARWIDEINTIKKAALEDAPEDYYRYIGSTMQKTLGVYVKDLKELIIYNRY